jgi:hypothetical protein
LYEHQTSICRLIIQAKGKVKCISRRQCVSGDRKYGVPNLDPFLIEKIGMEHAGFKVSVGDMIVEGAKDTNLQDIR